MGGKSRDQSRASSIPWSAGCIRSANGGEFFGVHLQARLRVALQKFARISPLIPACGSLSVPIRVIRGFPPASARHLALADEAYELLFDDRAGHALHFGEAAGEGGCGLAAVVFYAGATNLILGK